MIKLWSRKNKEKSGKFFRQDDEGNDLFYPWGYPGEAFYINDARGKIFKFCFIFAAVVLAVIIAQKILFLGLIYTEKSETVLIELERIISPIYIEIYLNFIFDLVTFLYMFALALYVIIVWLFVRKKEKYTGVHHQKYRRWRLIALWIFLLVPSFIVYTFLLGISIIEPYHRNQLFNVMQIQGVAFLSLHYFTILILLYVLFKLIKTNGYFFYKPVFL